MQRCDAPQGSCPALCFIATLRFCFEYFVYKCNEFFISYRGERGGWGETQKAALAKFGIIINNSAKQKQTPQQQL